MRTCILYKYYGSDAVRRLGISLGNWLVLERWMNEDWMVETAGTNNVWDEWTWTNAVGANASTALADHWNSESPFFGRYTKLTTRFHSLYAVTQSRVSI